MAKKFQTVRIGTKEKCKVVYDMGEIPEGLEKGSGFVLTSDARYSDKTFPKGTKVTFVNYAVTEHPSSSDKYDTFLYRVALFRIKGDRLNRMLFAPNIEKV